MNRYIQQYICLHVLHFNTVYQISSVFLFNIIFFLAVRDTVTGHSVLQVKLICASGLYSYCTVQVPHVQLAFPLFLKQFPFSHQGAGLVIISRLTVSISAGAQKSIAQNRTRVWLSSAAWSSTSLREWSQKFIIYILFIQQMLLK